MATPSSTDKPALLKPIAGGKTPEAKADGGKINGMKLGKVLSFFKKIGGILGTITLDAMDEVWQEFFASPARQASLKRAILIKQYSYSMNDTIVLPPGFKIHMHPALEYGHKNLNLNPRFVYPNNEAGEKEYQRHHQQQKQTMEGLGLYMEARGGTFTEPEMCDKLDQICTGTKAELPDGTTKQYCMIEKDDKHMLVEKTTDAQGNKTFKGAEVDMMNNNIQDMGVAMNVIGMSAMMADNRNGLLNPNGDFSINYTVNNQPFTVSNKRQPANGMAA